MGDEHGLRDLDRHAWRKRMDSLTGDERVALLAAVVVARREYDDAALNNEYAVPWFVTFNDPDGAEGVRNSAKQFRELECESERVERKLRGEVV